MYLRYLRKYLSILFLFLFLTAKGLSYHSFTHAADEDPLKCELCEVVMLNEHTPLIATPEIVLSVNIDLPEYQNTELVSVKHETNFTSYNYCRPPPFSTV